MRSPCQTNSIKSNAFCDTLDLGKWSKLLYMLGTHFLEGGGGLGKRPWVCTDRWGGWTRDHGSVQTGGGMGKRPWVCTGRWGDGQETMGLYRQVGDGQETMGMYRQVGGWARDHGSVQTGWGVRQETMGLYRQVGDG